MNSEGFRLWYITLRNTDCLDFVHCLILKKIVWNWFTLHWQVKFYCSLVALNEDLVWVDLPELVCRRYKRVVGVVGCKGLHNSYYCALLTVNWTKWFFFITYSLYTMTLCKVFKLCITCTKYVHYKWPPADEILCWSKNTSRLS